MEEEVDARVRQVVDKLDGEFSVKYEQLRAQAIEPLEQHIEKLVRACVCACTCVCVCVHADGFNLSRKHRAAISDVSKARTLPRVRVQPTPARPWRQSAPPTQRLPQRCVCACVCVCVCVSDNLSICLPLRLSVCLSVCLSVSVCPFLCSSVRPSVCLSVCLALGLHESQSKFLCVLRRHTCAGPRTQGSAHTHAAHSHHTSAARGASCRQCPG
jgi:hypothetical protein